MSTTRDPWSDPATETEPGAPYAGPPPMTPAAGWGPAGGWRPVGMPADWPTYPYGAVPYGLPWPPPPRRPGQVVAAAVLSFVQAALVAIASAYLLLLGSLFTLAVAGPGFPGDGAALATEATVVAAVQADSAAALVAGGILVLSRRTPAARWTLVTALGLQLVLAGYWAVRLWGVLGGTGGPDPSAVLLFGVLCFAAAPAVALGLAVSRPARAWSGGGSGNGTAPNR